MDVHAAKGGRIDAVAMFIGTDVAHRVGRGVGVAVGVAVEAADPFVRMEAATIISRVELLLRERGDEQPEAFELFGVEAIFKELVVVRQGDELAFRHIA